MVSPMKICSSVFVTTLVPAFAALDVLEQPGKLSRQNPSIPVREATPRSLSDIAVRDEAKEVRPDARPQARKNRRRIRWNTLRIVSGRERRRWP
jgi:hypothetical protein